MNTVAVVLMTWQRIPDLDETINELASQTYKKFTLYISNGNISQKSKVNKIISQAPPWVKIVLTHDGNDLKSFRRFYVAKKAMEDGHEIILFLDDDVQIPNTYVEKCLNQYEPHSYKSGFAWSFQDHGSDYYTKRTRHYDNSHKIHYCGTGISMIDASIFKEKGLFSPPEKGRSIEDLWLSYYVDHILNWKLSYMRTPQVILGGGDGVALYREINRSTYTKKDFLNELIGLGWEI